MIVSEDKNINTSGLIIDARSITQLIYINSVFGKLFSNKDIFLIWKGSKDDLELANKLLIVPKFFYILDIDSTDKKLSFNFKNVRKIRALCKRITLTTTPNTLCTCFSSGLYFDIIKNALHIKDESVIQFDDGSINSFVRKRKFRLLRFATNLMHGFFHLPSDYIMFSDKRYNKIFTSINPKNIIDLEYKSVIDISPLVASSYKKLSDKFVSIKMSGSALFMSAPTIEAGRMTISEYHKLILVVYSRLKELDVNKIYLSKHPSEKNNSDSLYRKLGLEFTYANYPSELIMINKNISIVVNPINTTMHMAEPLGLLKNITDVISYVPAKSPYKNIRISSISKVLAKNNINHHVIDFDE